MQNISQQTSASKSRLNFNFKILTKPCTLSLNKSSGLITSSSSWDHTRPSSLLNRSQWVSEWVSQLVSQLVTRITNMIGLGSDENKSPLTSNQFMKEKKTLIQHSQTKKSQPVRMTHFGIPLIFQVYLSFAIMTKDLVAKYRWQKKGLG